MTVTRYRNRPVEVDTIQWTGDNEAEMIAFTGPANFQALDPRERTEDPDATAAVFDKLHSTWVLVCTGQHIVRGVKDEYYPIADDVLAETYEPAAATGQPPAADQTALRARLVSALDTAFQTFVSPLSDAGEGLELSEHLADAVLSVLPASIDRATVLEEAAVFVEAMNEGCGQAKPCASCDAREDAASELRRMADEAQQPATQALFCVCGAPAKRDGDRWTHQPGTGDGCLYRPDARPRCPDCQMPHVITPGMRLACASILASIRDRETEAWDVPDARPGTTDHTLTKPVRHAPGTAVLCADCRTKGHTVCMSGEGASETVHAIPLPGSNGVSSCCGRPPCEFVGERVTRDPAAVTCPGPAVGAQQPKETRP